MDSKLLTSLGKIAGLAGIALGVFFLLFRSVLQNQYLPQAGLNGSQAFHVIIAALIFTFGIAAIGVLASVISRGAPGPVPTRTLGILAVLVVAVLFAASKVGSTNSSDSGAESRTPTPTATVLAAPQKSFSDALTLEERDAASSHGVNVKSQSMGVSSKGAWVDLVITSGAFQTGGRYTQGQTIQVVRSDCESLSLIVKDIKLTHPPDVTWEDLRKMGPAAEALVTRKATLLLDGKCTE